MIYTVYHIPGIKAGCTNDIDRRNSENRQKYGKDISIDIVLQTSDMDEADELEQFINEEANYENQHQTYKHMSKMFNSPKHAKNSKETRDKVQLTWTEEKRISMGQKISETWGDVRKEEWSKRISGKNNHNYGKPAHNRGVPQTKETKDKIGDANRGKKRTKETKEKLSIRRKAYEKTEAAIKSNARRSSLMSGPKSPSNIKVNLLGYFFNSKEEACNFFGISIWKLNKIIKEEK